MFLAGLLCGLAVAGIYVIGLGFHEAAQVKKRRPEVPD